MKQNISKHRKTFGFLLLYVIITFLLLAISLKFDFTKIIAGGDTNPYLRPSLALHKSFFIWEDSVFGRMDINAYFRFFYVFPLFVLYQLLPWTIAQFVYWWLLFSLIPISFYLLSYYLTKNEDISFIAGLVYSWNLFTYIIFHTPTVHILYLYGFIPLAMLFYIRGMLSKRTFNVYLFVLILLYLPLLRIVNMLSLLSVFIPFTSYLVISYYLKLKLNWSIFIKRFLLILFLLLFLSLPSLITYYTSYKSSIVTSPTNIAYTKSALKLSFDKQMFNIIRFVGTYGWEKLWHEIGGLQSFSAANVYHKNPILLVLSFYPPLLTILFYFILLFSKGLDKRRKSFFSILFLLILLLLFIGKMANPPLGFINTFLYKHSLIFSILFRSAWKYMLIIILFLISLFLSLSLNCFNRFLAKKRFFLILLIILVIHVSYIGPALVIKSNLINSAWVVKIPSYYFELGEFLNADSEEFKVLPLPLTKHFSGYNPYTWGYVGPDPLETILNKPLIDKYHNLVLPPPSLEAVRNIENLSYKNLLLLEDYVKKFNIKYIIVRNDANMTHPYIKYHNSPNEITHFLQSNDFATFVSNFGNLSLYQIKGYSQIFQILLSEEKTKKNISKSNFSSQVNLVVLPYGLNHINFTNISNFRISFSFIPYRKNFVKNWKEDNYCILDSDFLKIVFEPFARTIILMKDKNKKIIMALASSFPRDKFFATNLRFIYKEHNFYGYINGIPSFNTTINNTAPLKLTHLVIGEDIIGKEKFKGNISKVLIQINNKTLLNKKVSSLTLNQTPARIINYQKINPTLWKVRVNATKPFMLSFAESYDPLWEARIYKEGRLIQKVKPTPLYGVINGFWINQTGKLNITIRYKPQDWFDIGLIISLTTFALCIIYLTKSIIKHKQNGKK